LQNDKGLSIKYQKDIEPDILKKVIIQENTLPDQGYAS